MKLLNLMILLIMYGQWAFALTETRVNLLGQPCLLEGPQKYKEANLVAIHSIGPAQINPNLSFPESLAMKDQIKKQIETVHKNSNLPPFPLLDVYRQKLEKRLKAQVNLLESLSTKSEESVRAARSNLHSEEIVSKFNGIFQKVIKLNKNASQYGELMDQLFELYNTGIGEDPQNDFYSALNKMEIRYQCSLEYNEDPADAE